MSSTMKSKKKQKQQIHHKKHSTKQITKASSSKHPKSHTSHKPTTHSKHQKHHHQHKSFNNDHIASNNLDDDYNSDDNEYDNNLIGTSLNTKGRGDSTYDKFMDPNQMKGFKFQKNKYFLEEDGRYAGRKQGEGQEDDQMQAVVMQQDQDGDEDEDEDEDEQIDFQMDEEDDDYQQNDDEANNNQDFQVDFQENQQEEEIQSNDLQPQDNQIKQALNMLKKKRHQTSQLLTQKLHQINKADKKHINQVRTQAANTSQSAYQQAIQLKMLLHYYDKLVQMRYQQQAELQMWKQFPKAKTEDVSADEENCNNKKGNTKKIKNIQNNIQLEKKRQQLEEKVLMNLDQSLEMYQKFGQKCWGISKGVKGKSEKVRGSQNCNGNGDDQQEDSQELLEDQVEQAQSTDLSNQQPILQMLKTEKQQSGNTKTNPYCGMLNVQQVYNIVKSRLAPISQQAQKQLIKWSQKTSILSSTTASQYNSLIMQTPVGQSKKVLSNWDRMANKCQQKRGPFKILFEDDQNIHQISDKQIYDDYDLFIELQKYYLDKLEQEDDNNQFLQSSTMKYLKNRQAAQLNKETVRKNKDVDRKASKNRKIRYNVHPKLLNFMPSGYQNCLQTRDEIVKNIFNCRAADKVQEQESKRQHSDKNTRKYSGSNMVNEDDLIDIE